MARAADASDGDCGPGAIRPITPKEFGLFQALIERESGIHLTPVKTALLEGRLSKRLRRLRLATYSDYYRLVTEDDPTERQVLIDQISTNETRFFREPQQFEFLETRVFPAWLRQAAENRSRKLVRAWSAACSTGEEPYSLAMSLLAHFPKESGWAIEILASDICTRVLDHAIAAEYPISRAGEIPEEYRRRFMLRGTRGQEGKMRAGPAIRSIVRFVHLNLTEPNYGFGAAFDLILCRNVLIYFDRETKQTTIDRVARALAPGGFLFLGAAECLGAAGHRLRAVGPAVYCP